MIERLIIFFTKNKYLLLSIFFALIAIFDLNHFGLSPTHDAEYHIMRFQQFYVEISQGIFFPRWAPNFNNGYGIPLFTYVYPLPNYIAAIFHTLGFGFIDSFKINMALAEVIGAIFFYLWSKKYWGEIGGLVSSIFYSFSPYHLVDIYVRGSVGEVWALAIFPGLLWVYSEFIDQRKTKYLVLSVIFLSLLIYAHNILALLFFSFFFFYAIVNFDSKSFIRDTKALIIIIF
ncbi:MAG TPA: 6-pyruvoyl-tetrahydropterin synthase-related protein, partial [Patescibacteria group bacterium]|nr:6-pyruvoyl-tetrahydropterin synthase-related protein [Patescibacteria group bacterium]